MRLLLALSALFVAGCGASESSLMPMKVGRTWGYQVRGRELAQVATFNVNRRLSVAGTNGYEISSDFGISRLAWVGTTLVADRLAGTAYDPPLPLLDSRTAAPPIVWEGSITTAMGLIHGTATQAQEAAQFPMAGRKMPAVKSTIEIKCGGNNLELLSWYVDGTGLVRQEELSGKLSATSLTMTSGT